ncbi:hypothetical protein Tamer19_41500 [Cupriavidus sp. TA19]|uniref:hypothetical protein n=1 Tax=Cupriavidus sp. TA19 TaxID=701108 RepID=UPI0027294595|nr:hypothetical protein [Cupriavidus sp. TA19]GLC94742.1 hypothetical protein Tamer19_41500 [Cupriavidus sp. TA19]
MNHIQMAVKAELNALRGFRKVPAAAYIYVETNAAELAEWDASGESVSDIADLVLDIVAAR